MQEILIVQGQLLLTKSGLRPVEEVRRGDFVWGHNGWVELIDIEKEGFGPVCGIRTHYTYGASISNEQKISITNDDGICLKTAEELETGKLDNTRKGREKNKPIGGDCINMMLGDGSNAHELIKLDTDSCDSYGMSHRKITIPEYLNVDLAWLLGNMYGDGHIHGNKKRKHPHAFSISCATNEPQILHKIQQIIKEQFNIETKPTKGITEQVQIIQVSSTKVIKFLQDNHICKQKCGDLVLPNKILQSPPEIQMSFISGYIDADGCGQRTNGSYTISSICKPIFEQFKMILLSMGILSNLHVQREEGVRKVVYQMSLCQTSYILAITGVSMERMYKLSNSIKVRNNFVPIEYDRTSTPYTLMNLGIFQKDFLRDLFESSPHDYYRFITLKNLIIYEDRTGKKYPHVFKDTIIKTTQLEEQKIYKIKTKEPALIWSNGVLLGECLLIPDAPVLDIQDKHKWTQKEDKLLKSHPEMGCDNLAEQLEVSIGSVYARRQHLELSKPSVRWRQEDIEFLRKNYTIMNDKELAEELGRTEGSIHTKRSKLGLSCSLRRGVPKKKWGPKEDKFIEENWSVMSDEEIGEKLGRTIASIIQRRTKKLGLYCNHKQVS